MSILGKSIKNNIMTGENKYKNDLQKIGQVININDNNTYTVSVITRDGISSIEYNVTSKLKDDAPKKGDFVELSENFKRFTITGLLNNEDMTMLNGDVYSNVYGGATNGFVGY